MRDRYAQFSPRSARYIFACDDTILLDKQHLSIRRQRPKIIRDERLEPVGAGSYLIHRRDYAVAHVFGMSQWLGGSLVSRGVIEIDDGFLQCSNRRRQ